MSATKPETVAAQEQALAQARLSESCDGLVAAVAGLSETQWQFKSAPGRWSIADVVEHLAVIEGRVHLVLAKMETAPSAPPDRDANKIDARILRHVPDRSHSTPAPEHVRPTGRWTAEAALNEYREARKKTAAIAASSSCLRGRVIDHPILGPLDGHQWLLTASAHSVRHTQQILEVKAAPNFPAA
jgi:DinB superfamily